jgi:hypothetical protein
MFMAINWPSQCCCLGGSVTPTCQLRPYRASVAGVMILVPASVSLIVASPRTEARSAYVQAMGVSKYQTASQDQLGNF